MYGVAAMRTPSAVNVSATTCLEPASSERISVRYALYSSTRTVRARSAVSLSRRNITCSNPPTLHCRLPQVSAGRCGRLLAAWQCIRRGIAGPRSGGPEPALDAMPMVRAKLMRTLSGEDGQTSTEDGSSDGLPGRDLMDRLG